MFTEGLDDNAINWINQVSVGDQQSRPLIEKCPLGSISNLPLLHKSSSFLSPKVLPPVKFHSGFLGIHPSTHTEDSEDDNESIASISGGHCASYSDTFEEDGMESSDSYLFWKAKDISHEEELKSKSESTGDESIKAQSRTLRRTLVRGPSKENLKVELALNGGFLDTSSTSSAHFPNHEHVVFTESTCYLHDDYLPKGFKELGTPSAPPITDCGREESIFGEEGKVKSESFEVSPDLECQIQDTKYPPSQTGVSTGNISVERDEKTYSWQNKLSIRSQDYTSSAENSWQSFVAYDACFRLCLYAWARNCVEAPEFLRDECMMLRDAFGIQKYLLQPKGNALGERRPITCADGTCTRKERKEIWKIEVEVKKIRIVAQRPKLRCDSSSPKLVMQASAEYVHHATEFLKNKINTLKATSVSVTHKAFSCLLQLYSSCEELVSSPLWFTPGTGESHIFYPESQGDALLIQVQDNNNVNLGQAKIPISLLNSEAQQGEKVKWWPMYLEDQGFVGKIQLATSVFWSSSDRMNFSKASPPVETLVYDLVMEASMRACDFHAKNLRIHGPWKWLLNEFSSYYGVTPAYTKLRYLSYIINISVPTKECLELICELLEPVLKARNERNLTRQEKSILLDCEDQIKNLLATTFQNYKSLDENSSTGLSNFFGPIPETASPALTPAIKLFSLLHDILSQEAQNILRNYLKTAAEKRCRRYLVDTEEFMSANCDVTEPITISTAYSKMRILCLNISSEIQADMKIQNQNILPSCIDLPNIAASIYSVHLCQRLRNFLSAFPPSKPAPHVIELLVTTADFERDLNSWSINPVHGGVISRDLFHYYIETWIKDTQYQLVENCKAEKISFSGISTHYATSPFVEDIYGNIMDSLNEYKVVVNRWPQYLLSLESAVAHIERAIIKALEKQYSEVLMPLKDGVPKKIEKHMQKLTRKQSTAAYSIPNELGVFLNTMKRILDGHHCRIEENLKSSASFWTLSNKNESFGERTNGITIMLRTNYKNYKQAIIRMLVDNTEANKSTRLKKILEETKETKGEAEIRERMQALSLQLSDSVRNLHAVFTKKIFVEICREFWDKMGQIVLSFLESRKENRIWYRRSGSGHVLGILDDVFASEMQTLQGNSIHDEDLEPPRSVVEARSILS
ncbi:uncharacterized protein LOC110022142 isoform X2 [Phalaenopsis equestris]|uniref:uncharacterized protein LOC110022142 isoform X2 n=1 Tax=Phalaenopsis equestris TaxID=78828 RepID=UPI0009E4D111|nr:uncharacterized protein LOC110022142 isoform X2 [Phalaenopsis equestris]